MQELVLIYEMVCCRSGDAGDNLLILEHICCSIEVNGQIH